MDFKKFLPNQEKDQHEYYWSLIIEPNWVQAGIWRIDRDQTQVLFTSSPVAWATEEELVSSADAALSSAIQHFPEDLQEPSKTVFAVVSSWVAEGQIKPEFLEKIKKICSELSLTPVGFVVLSEAISHFVKTEEGSPLNAVVAGLYKENIEISVFKLGNLLGTTTVARSVSLADDMTEGLTRFAGEQIPSRFILYNGREGDLEEARQNLLKINWSDFPNLKFLHTPKVEIIDVERKVQAVSLAGASEMASVKGVKDLSQDVREEVQEMESNIVPLEDESEVKAEDLGFVVDEDIAEIEKDAPVENIHSAELQRPEVPVEPVEEGTFEEKPTARPKIANKLPLLISNLKSKVSSIIPHKLPKDGSGDSKRAFTIGVTFLAILFVAGFLFWWFYPKATVTVYLSPTKLEENLDVSVDPNASDFNVGEGILPGSVKETSVTGEKTKDTTGMKTVGDKAKGEVKLFRVGTELEIPSGTKVIGPDNLSFSLDESVTVASGSASSPGTATGKVTADDIGASYNLASGTSFRVGNYSTSDIEAKNETSFSGGSSREINAVSEDDQSSLMEDLSGELEDAAKEKIISSLSADEIFVDESLVATTSSQTYSNKVGDEATSLKLSLEMDAEALVVKKEKLLAFAREILKDKVPEGFVLRDEQIEVEFEFDEKDGEIFKFSLNIQANLLPAVDPQVIAEKISGKYPILAEDYLTKELPGFSRAEIKIKPSFPGKLKTLPRTTKNIEVEIAAER